MRLDGAGAVTGRASFKKEGGGLCAGDAVVRGGRGFELASTSNSLYAGTARLQVPPAP